MSAYVISELEVRDPTAIETYRTIAAKSIAQYGGRYLVRNGAASVAEGGRRRKASSWSSFPRWSDCANGMRRRNTPKRSRCGGPRWSGG